MLTSTHLAAYDSDGEVIFEPPPRVLGIDCTTQRCQLTFFDHLDIATGEADVFPGDEQPDEPARVQ